MPFVVPAAALAALRAEQEGQKREAEQQLEALKAEGERQQRDAEQQLAELHEQLAREKVGGLLDWRWHAIAAPGACMCLHFSAGMHGAKGAFAISRDALTLRQLAPPFAHAV